MHRASAPAIPPIKRRESRRRISEAGGVADDEVESKLQKMNSQLITDRERVAAELDEVLGMTLSTELPTRRLTLPEAEPLTPLSPQSSIDPLTPASARAPWRTWSVEDVSKWLIEQGFQRFVETFRDCDCQGEDLELITSQDLNDDFEIESVEDRRQLLEKIQALIRSGKS